MTPTQPPVTPQEFTFKLDGFNAISDGLQAIANIQTAHNAYLQLMLPEQRAKVIDMEIGNATAWYNFAAPFRALADLIQKQVGGK